MATTTATTTADMDAASAAMRTASAAMRTASARMDSAIAANMDADIFASLDQHDAALGQLMQRSAAFIEEYWDYSDTLVGANSLGGRCVNITITDGNVLAKVCGDRPLPAPSAAAAELDERIVQHTLPVFTALVQLIESEVTALWRTMSVAMDDALFAGADWSSLLTINFDTAPGERCHEDTVEVCVTNPAQWRAFDRSGRGDSGGKKRTIKAFDVAKAEKKSRRS